MGSMFQGIPFNNMMKLLVQMFSNFIVSGISYNYVNDGGKYRIIRHSFLKFNSMIYFKIWRSFDEFIINGY